MFSLISIFTAAFVLGMVFNAAPGAIFAETIRRSLTGGFDAALRVQIGSLVGDAVWAVLGLAGVGILLQAETLKVPVGIAGATYLAWLAWDSWRESLRATTSRPAPPAAKTDSDTTLVETSTQPKPSEDTAQGALRSGMILSLSNPQNVAYWAALGSAFGAIGVSDPTGIDYTVFFAGFMVSSLVWCFVCAAAVSRLFRGRGGAWHVWTYRICAIAFAYLALGTVQQVIRVFTD